ncbi:hypothetical protein [Pseudothermotoga sp.]|uniref:hypothetical protein n=1 Tax=Pseudothermotoga sp. TaxID=2033661 RepID=UPI0031F6188E
MKKVLVLTMALVVLTTVVSFATGKFNYAPQKFSPEWRQPITTWRQPMAPAPRYQFRQQFSYEEAFEAMDLSKEQAQKLLLAIKDAKAKLEGLDKEYKSLYEKAKDMTVYEFRTQIRELNQKRAEVLRELSQKVAETLKVGQLQSLMEHYKLRRAPGLDHWNFGPNFRGFAKGPALFDEDFIDALEEYAK